MTALRRCGSIALPLCIALCTLDLFGVLPHGKGTHAGAPSDEMALCMLAGVAPVEAATAIQDVQDGRWCPSSSGIAIERYRGAILCALAAKGFRLRAARRSVSSALKHFVAVLGDWWNFGASNLLGTFEGQRRNLAVGGFGKFVDGSIVLESLVEPGGVFEVTTADVEKGTTFEHVQPMSFTTYAMETLTHWLLLLLLLVVVWLPLVRCRHHSAECCWMELAKSGSKFEPVRELRHCVQSAEREVARVVAARQTGVMKRPSSVTLVESVPSFHCLDIPRSQRKLRLGLCCDTDCGELDLDFAAVVFDQDGDQIDAVYLDHIEAPGLTYSGEDTIRRGNVDNKAIDIELDDMLYSARQIFISIHAKSRRGVVDFKHFPDAYCRLLDSDARGRELARYSISSTGKRQSVIVARLVKGDDNAWKVQFIGKFSTGRLWSDCVSDMRMIFSVDVRKLAPSGLKSRAETIDFSAELKHISAVLGWDLTNGEVDLDVSAVLFGGPEAGVDPINAVYFNNQSAPGIHHSGDNLTGEGDGDDETIKIDFDELPEDVQQIFFCVNAYNPPGVTFANISAAYCKVLDMEGGGGCLAEYRLSESDPMTGLIIARLVREGPSWSFQRIGKYCNGQTWRDLVPEMRHLRAALNAGDVHLHTTDSKRRRIA